MNRDRAKELLPIIQAFAEGKTLQYKDAGDTEWHDNGPLRGIGFYDKTEYRIKPEPREFWIVKSGTPEPYSHYGWVSHDKAESFTNNDSREIIKVREVIE